MAQAPALAKALRVAPSARPLAHARAVSSLTSGPVGRKALGPSRRLPGAVAHRGPGGCLPASKGGLARGEARGRGSEVPREPGPQSRTRYDFDLFTIGGGSGGVRGSRWAAQQYGAKAGRESCMAGAWEVAVAELPFAIVSTKLTAGGLGGTCVIRGCVPKKSGRPGMWCTCAA